MDGAKTDLSDKVTLAEVARRADVSPMTVSRVVNGRSGVGAETRERVERIVRELDYRPNNLARGLKASRSRTIGLLVPDITNPFFPDIVRGAEDEASRSGFTLFLTNVLEDTGREAGALRAFEDRRVDGVIACSPRMPAARLHELLGQHAAAVVVNRKTPFRVAGSVRPDYEQGARMAVEHLFATGRRTLGVLAGPESSYAGRERLRGIAAAAGELGLEIPAERSRHSLAQVEAGAEEAARLLSEHPDVDALVCFNDLIAAGALQACTEGGRHIPDDVAVIGYDDIAFARMFSPPLTTIRVPRYDLGVNAMRMLLDRIEGRNRNAEVILRPELVVRSSTGGRQGSDVIPNGT